MYFIHLWVKLYEIEKHFSNRYRRVLVVRQACQGYYDMFSLETLKQETPVLGHRPLSTEAVLSFKPEEDF